jgi:Alginate lyase
MRKLVFPIFLLSFSFTIQAQNALGKVTKVLKKEVLTQAQWALTQAPITVTAAHCERSAGGLHDFYSEGDYWWPNPDDPQGPYIQRDGQSNPGNFTAHRQAMVRFSQIIGALASAYRLTKKEQYVQHAFTHLRAWFIAEQTHMNPSLLYAQAIKGRVTGRGIGIIDMIQMMEVAQGIRVLESAKGVDRDELTKIKNWFAQYLSWVTTHQYGLDERDAKNNHGTCWVMQVAVFAKLTGNQALIEDCKNRFKTILLPNQMDSNGSFPLELRRTKPYGYSLFNMDAMASICHILSDEQENLWEFTLPDGRQLRKAIEFMYPFVANKSSWTYPKDVMYWEEWPVAQPFLLFAHQQYRQKEWLDTWLKLEHFPKTEEVVRNLPIRNPVIWLE